LRRAARFFAALSQNDGATAKAIEAGPSLSFGMTVFFLLRPGVGEKNNTTANGPAESWPLQTQKLGVAICVWLQIRI
jgi:hypothetical protein